MLSIRPFPKNGFGSKCKTPKGVVESTGNNIYTNIGLGELSKTLSIPQLYLQLHLLVFLRGIVRAKLSETIFGH